MDFTSIHFPYLTSLFDDEQTEEGHVEPADESVKSSVVDFGHPLLSTNGLKSTVNFNRSLGNSKEKLITGDIKIQTLKDIVKAAYKTKFPLEPLIFALDVEKKLDERSGASDSNSIIGKITSYVPELKNILGRQPYNSEVMMAYMLSSASQVKTLLEKAKNQPYEKSTPVGSKFDDIIFYKLKNQVETIRNNKEVVQYFVKRMNTGSNVFPHSPFDIGNLTP